jgi:hypothetical protein
MSLLEEVIAAHGGRDAWESAREVTADLRSWGLALAMKRAGGPFRSYRARVTVGEPRTVITPYPGGVGVFERDSVWIETESSGVVECRDHMRRRFPGLRRRLWWDPLDALYFAGYALWNYFNTPLLLARCHTEETGSALRVRFPPDVPTHSPTSTFHFDERRLLVRLDYTAEVFGKWARGKHVCSEHRTFDGLVFPTVRRVTFRGTPWPVLVAIDVDDVTVTRG